MPDRVNTGCRLATALLLLSPGCFWTTRESIGDVMWSDDDEMFAIIVTRVDVATHTLDEASSDQKSRDVRKRIFVMPSDFSEEPVAITAEHGTSSVSAFLMSGAGYLLADWDLDDGSVIRQYMLDGDALTVARSQDEPDEEHPNETCGVRPLPSPEGEFIALITACGFSDDASAFVRIVDAYSHEIVLERTSIPPRLREIWTPDSRFAVLGGGGEGIALYWSPGSTTLASGPDPACRWPPTTSGPVAEDGTIISPGNDLDEPIEFSDDRPVNSGQPLVPFGCP